MNFVAKVLNFSIIIYTNKKNLNLGAMAPLSVTLLVVPSLSSEQIS